MGDDFALHPHHVTHIRIHWRHIVDLAIPLVLGGITSGLCSWAAICEVAVVSALAERRIPLLYEAGTTCFLPGNESAELTALWLAQFKLDLGYERLSQIGLRSKNTVRAACRRHSVLFLYMRTYIEYITL